MAANDTKLAERIAEVAWSDPQKEFSHTVAVIEGVLNADDKRRHESQVQLSDALAKADAELERLRADCECVLSGMRKYQETYEPAAGMFRELYLWIGILDKALEGGDASE